MLSHKVAKCLKLLRLSRKRRLAAIDPTFDL